MKRVWMGLLVVVLLLSFALFAMGSGSSDEDASVDQGSGTVDTPTEDPNTLGDYKVEIVSCRLAKDYGGKDVVIVKYNYTNVSNDTATSFMVAVDDNVYQNGVGLNRAIIIDDSVNYNSDDQMKEIKKGASLEVEIAYELNDTTTDIEVKVSELISFDDKVLKKIFSLK